MNFLIIIVILIISGVLLFYIKVAKHHVAAMFVTQYNIAVESGKNKKEAIFEAINFFRYRYPFDQLIDQDVDEILSIILKLKDPLLIATIFQHCERKREVKFLKNYHLLEEILTKQDNRDT